jgi:hypothetical protein
MNENMNVVKPSTDQIKETLAKLKAAQAQLKEWKKAGVEVKAPKAEKAKTPEFLLLATEFKTVIDSNIELIKKFFEASKTLEKPLGNTGINFRVKDEVFYVQVLSQEAQKAKQAPAKKAEETPTE